MTKVTEILEENVRTGTGSKGDWAMHLVKLDDDDEVRIFAPIEVGDEVESYEYNGYTNWRKAGGNGGGGSSKKSSSSQGGGKNYDKELKELRELTVSQNREIAELKRLIMTIGAHLEVDMAKPKETETTEIETDDGKSINVDDIPF